MHLSTVCVCVCTGGVRVFGVMGEGVIRGVATAVVVGVRVSGIVGEGVIRGIATDVTIGVKVFT